MARRWGLLASAGGRKRRRGKSSCVGTTTTANRGGLLAGAPLQEVGPTTTPLCWRQRRAAPAPPRLALLRAAQRDGAGEGSPLIIQPHTGREEIVEGEERGLLERAWSGKSTCVSPTGRRGAVRGHRGWQPQLIRLPLLWRGAVRWCGPTDPQSSSKRSRTLTHKSIKIIIIIIGRFPPLHMWMGQAGGSLAVRVDDYWVDQDW